jgi:phage shock protein PspC (stress-responsive transcriptional regulator)
LRALLGIRKKQFDNTLIQQGLLMEVSGMKKLMRSRSGFAGGVCAGLAKHYGLQKGGLQACFVIGSCMFGATALLYLVLWLILPLEDQTS